MEVGVSQEPAIRIICQVSMTVGQVILSGVACCLSPEYNPVL